MELRHHPGVQGKRDAYPFDPRLLKVDANYNVRDLESEEERAELDELKESIRSNGVKVPLEVRFTGEDVYVVAGHRRHKAAMELISEGVEIATVLIITEPKNTNDAERDLNLVTSNSGKPLKPLQIAEVVRRLLAHGWDESKIAARIGKTVSSVRGYIEMLAMPAAVQDAVKHNDISATEARKLTRDNKADPEFATKLIADMKAENAKWPKGGKIKPRHVKAKLAKEKPKQDPLPEPAAAPEPEQVEATELPQPASALAATFETEHSFDNIIPMSDEPIDFGTEQAPTVQHQPRLNGVKHLIDALEPFAALAEFNDLNAKSDDDVIEVKVVDIKRAWKAYTDATGDVQ